MQKAVFFDRDGVLNIDKDYITSPDEFVLYEEVGNIIEHCRNIGYKTVIVTNQPAVARGLISENNLTELHNKFKQMLLKKNPNAIIDKICYCPHHPDAELTEYRISCSCRKPKPGMIIDAAAELNIDLTKSYMIGDRISDIIAGKLAGCATIQCKTGKHTEKMIKTDLDIKESIIPDYVIEDLSELKELIK